MTNNYYQKQAETMPVEEIRKLQSQKLVKQVQHVYDNVPYYRNLMDEKGVRPEDIRGIEDLHKLPFISKADLRDSYPDGMLATKIRLRQNSLNLRHNRQTCGRILYTA